MMEAKTLRQRFARNMQPKTRASVSFINTIGGQTLTQENADCVICEFFENDTQKEIVRGSNTGAIEHRTQEEMLYALYDFKIESYLWTMLFRRKCISTPFYPFKIVEDYATISSWMLHVKKAVFLHVPLYHYRQTKGRSSHVTQQ